MRDKLILYFVKYPEPGKVKTRLAKALGDEAACQAYRDLAEANFRIIESLAAEGIENVVAFDPPDKEREIREWLPAPCYFPQQGKDLGERLHSAFQDAFDQGAKMALVLGSDTLGLNQELILEAFDALENFDVVLGPAKDGGYYLIGLSSPQPFLFQNIPWSTSDVFSTTLAKVKENGLSYYLLPELDDLDEIKNLETRRIFL